MERENLLKQLNLDIKECLKFEKQKAKKGDYVGAIKLQGMVDAYKKVKMKLLYPTNPSNK